MKVVWEVKVFTNSTLILVHSTHHCYLNGQFSLIRYLMLMGALWWLICSGLAQPSNLLVNHPSPLIFDGCWLYPYVFLLRVSNIYWIHTHISLSLSQISSSSCEGAPEHPTPAAKLWLQLTKWMPCHSGSSVEAGCKPWGFNGFNLGLCNGICHLSNRMLPPSDVNVGL